MVEGMRIRTLLSVVAAFVLLVVMAVPAVADGHLVTELKKKHQNIECEGEGLWHFVHNKAPKHSDPGTIEVTFSTGMVTKDARAVGKGKTQHYWVRGYGDLITAWDNLPGKLVLSWYKCYGGPSEPPSES